MPSMVHSAELPFVSIVTPVLNRVQYIQQAIQSVLDQAYTSTEHVIVDGGSTDGTADLLARYHARYPDRVRYVSEPDRGGCEGFNKGCRLARGKIFGWLGSDDIYLPQAIAHVARYFLAHPDEYFVYGEAEFIDASNRVVGRFATQDFSVERSVNHGACIAFPAAFYRREVVDRIGGFRIHDRACDHEWTIRAGKIFPFSRLPITVCQFRLHPGSTTASKGDVIYPRANFLINRLHGGSLLSPVCLRYYRSLLFRVPGVKMAWERLFWVRGFRQRLKNEDVRIAIFGAALSGFQCREYLHRQGRSVPLFIDNSPPAGKTYCDLPVYRPEQFMSHYLNSADAVMIATAASSRHAPAMKRQLRRLGFKKRVYRFRI